MINKKYNKDNQSYLGCCGIFHVWWWFDSSSCLEHSFDDNKEYKLNNHCDYHATHHSHQHQIGVTLHTIRLAIANHVKRLYNAVCVYIAIIELKAV